MGDWKETELNLIAEVQTGPFGSQLKNEQYIIGGTPVITVEHLKDFKIIDFDYPSVTEEDKDRLSRYLLKEGDIVFTRVGSVDLSAYVKKHQDGWMFSSRMLRVRPNLNLIYPRFLSYYFQQQNFRDYILNISVGATMPSINTGILKGIPISFPDLLEQKAIASVLSSLDDKIDLLHQQNATLEKMAETLFRQWFVEEAKEEWEEGKLGDVLLSIESGTRPKGGIDPELKNGIPSIGAESINGIGNFDFSKTKFITEDFFKKMNRGIIKENDVLIYKDGAYVGRKGMFGNNFPFKVCTVNEHVFILRCNNRINQMFLYFLLQEDQLAQLNANSAQPGLNQESMKSFEIVIPPKEELSRFEKTVKPWVNKILSNSTQIQTLSSMRDNLLPKLMSGEVRVATEKD